MKMQFRLLDVFTTTMFGGNPLAVFPAAPGSDARLLQAVAKEINLSECVFADPVADRVDEWRMRIFTPAMELSFAGHPTIGAALALTEGRHFGEEPVRIVLHEAVGPVPVEITRVADRVVARLTVPVDPVEHASCGRRALATMLSLEEDDVCDGVLAPRAFACGVPFQIVRLSSPAALTRAKLRRDLWERDMSGAPAPHLYLFASTPGDEDADIRARMFAPLMGVDEDSATGGGAAALAGFLAATDASLKGRSSWQIRQGVEMGRPSLIELEAEISSGLASAVTIGGSAVFTGSGQLDVPVGASQ